MSDFEDKLDSILNNPQAMSQIMSLAQSLGGSDKPSPPAPSSEHAETSELPIDSNMLSSIAMLFNQSGQNEDQRVALLNALRPFVKEKRYAKLDKAIQITRMARMARMALEMLKEKEGLDV